MIVVACRRERAGLPAGLLFCLQVFRGPDTDTAGVARLRRATVTDVPTKAVWRRC